jgi:hypothetical protein
MNLQDFLNHLTQQEGLVIDIEKHTETLDATIDSLTASLELVLSTLTRHPPTADQLKALEKNDFYSVLVRVADVPKGVQVFGALTDAVIGMGNACHYLIDELPETLVAESVSARDGSALFALSVMMNAADALTRYLNDMFADVTGTPKFAPGAMIKLMQRDMMSTAQIVAAVIKGTDNMLDDLLAIPDLRITGEVAKRSGQQAKRMGLISLKWNPLFIARMMLAQRRIRKLKLLLEEKRLIEARIAMYIENSNGNLSPAAEKAVKYYQDVVTKMTAEIERLS